ncbi:MAG: TonB-dependent receptor [Burkholderiales bacterium]|nr:TonB-dependent receptor [Burkholderiales bacterium]
MIHLPRSVLALGALACLSAAAQIAPAPAPTETEGKDAKPPPGPTLNRVEVIGTNTETEQRRASTASKIIIGKEDIERFGDSSVSEVLKRLPGVTTGGRPGRGGDVRMRGMGGGYTQLLVNGERMPPGFSLDNLPPDQVERIEVLRAPTAEFGARAVAGTINIVLKEALKKTLNEVKLGVGKEEDRYSPSASWTRNDKFGDNVAYTFTLSVNHDDRRDQNDTRTRWYDLTNGNQVLDQRETGHSTNLRDGLHLNGRVQIALGQGESLVLMPFMALSQGTSFTQSRLDQAPGGIIAQPYASYTSDGDGRFGMLRTNAQWQKNLGDGTRVELRAGVGGGSFDSHSLRREYDTNGAQTRIVDDQSNTRENGWSLIGKLSQQLENEHSLVSGVELDNSKRRQSRTTLQNGTPILTEFGDDLQASSMRMAAYIQDEWNPSKQLSAYAGLRWEGIETTSDSDAYRVSNKSGVLTPLLHATWRPDEKSRDQWRTSLTRSYKAATLQELIARPAISQRFPTGSNEVSSPDRAGNPNLAPELARGFEIAYEHYLEKGGLMSANFFYRRISDLIRNVVALEDVSWSSDKRWVSRPQNVGNATAQGIELEAKFRMDERWPDALPVSLRANVSFFDSQVEQVPGPNNRLEGQPKGTANIGADYRFRGLPLSVGASVNYTPAYDLQLSDIQSTTMGAKVVSDAFLVWFINPSAQLRLSANNLAPRDYLSTSSILNGTQRQDTESANPSKIRWGVRLELKL